MSCLVVKIIKGHPYLYKNTSTRINGKVHTKTVYLGKAGYSDLSNPNLTHKAQEKLSLACKLPEQKKTQAKRQFKIAKTTKESPYKTITDNIIKELEKGVIPWVKPWTCEIPKNCSTGRNYSGVNILALWQQAEKKGYKKQNWLTFNQAKSLGGRIKKGEKGTQIVLVRDIQIKPKEKVTLTKNSKEKTTPEDQEKSKTIKLLKKYTVFNIEQTENLPEEFYSEKTVLQNPEINSIIKKTGATIQHGGNKAYFSPGSDSINLPSPHNFESMPHYYSTAFHELGHWTGGKTRLNRNQSGKFGSKEYAKEELIAELSSAFSCAKVGIKGKLRHASYIQSWLKLLREDERALLSASSLASKATDFLM